MQKSWLICLAAVALGGLLAEGAATLSIDDLGRRSPSQAAPDLAANEGWDERGVSPLGGEVGSAPPEIEGVEPTLVPEPTPLVLVSLGMVGLVFAGRRRSLPASS